MMMKKIALMLFALTNLLSCRSQDTDYLITLETKYGDIGLILYDQTPKHKDNFIHLAKTGKYDSTTFHRIIKNFMIQGGDLNTRPNSENLKEYTIPAEFVDTLIHHRGALSAARQGDHINPNKESSGTQFYIVQGNVFEEWQLTTDLKKVHAYLPKLAEVPGYDTVLTYLDSLHRTGNFDDFNKAIKTLVPVMQERFDLTFQVPVKKERIKVYSTIGGAPHLDDTYTVFGRVVSGMEVVDKIASVKTGHMDKPLEEIYVKVRVQEMPKAEWKEKFGGKPY